MRRAMQDRRWIGRVRDIQPANGRIECPGPAAAHGYGASLRSGDRLAYLERRIHRPVHADRYRKRGQTPREDIRHPRPPIGIVWPGSDQEDHRAPANRSGPLSVEEHPGAIGHEVRDEGSRRGQLGTHVDDMAIGLCGWA